MSDNKTEHKNHVLPISVYLSVATALLILTTITVYVAQLDFGAYNLLVAMIIAGVKATLVALYFMHLKYDNKLYAIIFVGSLLFLSIFVILTMFDTLRRDEIYQIKQNPINPDAVIYQKAVILPDSAQFSDSLINDSLPTDSAIH